LCFDEGLVDDDGASVTVVVGDCVVLDVHHPTFFVRRRVECAG
jgi:hypothetical protein